MILSGKFEAFTASPIKGRRYATRPKLGEMCALLHKKKHMIKHRGSMPPPQRFFRTRWIVLHLCVSHNTLTKRRFDQTQPIWQVALPPIMPTANGDRTESRVKMTRMRMRIAERLKSAQNTAAMLTTFQEVRA